MEYSSDALVNSCLEQLLAEKMPELLDFDKDLVHLEAASKVCWLCF